MLKQIIDKFLERYTGQFSLAGYTMQKLCIKETIAVFQMKSSEYIINFSFYDELPCRLVVDIYHAGYFPVNSKLKNEKLNQELAFFPFNLPKHEKLDNLQKMIGLRIGVYDTHESIDNDAPFSVSSFYNIRHSNKLFDVISSMSRSMGSKKAFSLNSYVINVTKDGEIFYTTSILYSFANSTIIFNSNDDIYSYENVDYHESELENLLFKLMVEKIAPDIYQHTEYAIIDKPEHLVVKAIELYKMVKI